MNQFNFFLFTIIFFISVRLFALPTQQVDSISHKHFMFNAINCGDYSKASSEIKYVENWMLDTYVDIDMAVEFFASDYFLGIFEPTKDSLVLYVGNLLDKISESVYIEGDVSFAITCLEYQLNIFQNYFGKNSSEYALSLNNIGILFYHIGEYKKAELYYTKSLEIEKNKDNIDSLSYGNTFYNLGVLNYTIGNYIKAEKYFLKFLEIFEQNKTQYLSYAISLMGLGGVYEAIGDYCKAEKHLLEAKKILFQEKDTPIMDKATLLNNLSTLYVTLGDYVQAETYALQALDLARFNEDKISVIQYSTFVNNLGTIYSCMGNYIEAERCYKESLLICRKIAKNHDYATSLYNLGELYHDVEKYSLAKKYYKQAFKVGKSLEIGSVFTSIYPLNGLAKLYKDNGNLKKANELYSINLKLIKDYLGSKNFEYASTLVNIGSTVKNVLYSYPFYLEAFGVLKSLYVGSLNFMIESQRTLYWQTMQQYFISIFPNYIYQHYMLQSFISTFAYNNELFLKGILLNSSEIIQYSILESNDTMLIRQWNELVMKKQQILVLQEKESMSNYIVQIKNEMEQLEKQITISSAVYRKNQAMWKITWDSVKNHLSSNEVAIEFFSAPINKDSTLYCALLLRNNSQYPEMITLFEEKDILPYISSKTEANTTNKIYDFYANGEVIKNKIWGNILPKIKEGETVYFSPSGLFHQLAIESLPYDENRKMLDVYNLVRLSSTREIVLNRGNSNQYSTATLYGGIHYDTSSKDLLAESKNYSQEKLLASRGVENDTLDRGSVNYLPGTKQEAEKINKMLVDNNITAQLYTMSQANEESFKNLSNKHQNIIHIGTHGFTWTDSVAKKKDYFAERMQMIGDEQQYRGPIIDPLNRCGLLFAGANIALQGKSRELPGGVQDGILTAKEISLLDLRDCDLVVLSACETAKGDITSEGVFGLQRAFKMAGVQTIIMSLWKVHDEATQMLMTEFYNNWIVKKQPKREAFKNAQNAVRKEYEEPEYWAGFVMLD